MDKLITTNNGGMPFDLDDIRWLEKGINDSFKAIGRGLANSNTDVFVLFGCELSDGGSSFSLASGAIWALDEFWIVDAHTVAKLSPSATTGGSNSYYLKQVIAYDATGSETFESGIVIDTYQKRRLELTNSEIDGTPTGTSITNVNVLDMPTLNDKLVDRPTVDALEQAVTTINDNRVRACIIRQVTPPAGGQSYINAQPLTSSFSKRFGDPSMFAIGNALGIKMESFSVYKFTINSIIQNASKVCEIKNVPSGVFISESGITIQSNGDVQIDKNNESPFVMVNDTASIATLLFSAFFDGNLSILVEKIA